MFVVKKAPIIIKKKKKILKHDSMFLDFLLNMILKICMILLSKLSKESFSKGFMVIANLPCNVRLKIKGVENWYWTLHTIRNILIPFFKHEILFLYSRWHQSVELNEDKASNCTSQYFVNFLEKMDQETGIRAYILHWDTC